MINNNNDNNNNNKQFIPRLFLTIIMGHDVTTLLAMRCVKLTKISQLKNRKTSSFTF